MSVNRGQFKVNIGLLSEYRRGFILKSLSIFLIIALFLNGCASTVATGSNEDKPVEVGEYVPRDFHFEGGSGRVEISCPKVTVEKDGAIAELVFDSKNYTYVKIGEKTYYKENEGEDESIFHIPVERDREMSILAQTMAMSTPHEIEYKIYVSSYPAAAEEEKAEKGTKGQQAVVLSDPKELQGLELKDELELKYAKCFHVYNYEDDYRLIQVENSGEYLLTPEGKEAPLGLPDSIVVLKAPFKHIYMAATSVMSLIYALEAEDSIAFSGADIDGWHIEGPGEDMKSGRLQYAGKYSAPDYERLVGGSCDLAVESTMILHTPDVKEKLNDLGIPVFIDNSSYENDPLGRMEWIKLYGVLLGAEDRAQKFFTAQEAVIKAVEKSVEGGSAEGKSVAVFSINTAGTVTVRKPEDYIPRMIEIAGGKYALSALPAEEGMGGTATISMEEFYADAGEADYLIYNATIENPLSSVRDLIDKEGLFKDFKAVKEGNVWQIGKDLYQATDIAGLLTEDIYKMFSADTADMNFLEKLP